VERAAEKIGDGITAEEIAKREDLRNVLTFTIDPRMPRTLTMRSQSARAKRSL